MVLHHGTNAIPEYNNTQLFPGMYPTLFPYGIGGFEDETCQTALYFDRQAKHMLNISDHKFRYHESFLFVVLNMLQRWRAHLQTYFAVRKSNFKTVARNLTSVSADVLQHLANRLEQECKISDLTEVEQNAFKLLHQVNTMSARILGSQASKIFVRNEIRNYFGYFGLPHIFFTFNPSAAHSPIFQVIYGDRTIDLSEHFPHMPDGRTRAICLAHDPVAAADFYEFSYQCLFRHLFRWDFDRQESVAEGGILGRVRAFYGTSE
ncbi:uncharacterized protein EDB93DRAFT_1096934, partial [Suillus bovinus]|uniref:uncharacterized protein n=1 Tax=Suillus bovinus TaxID=48563 RepID=UPI001B86C63D